MVIYDHLLKKHLQWITLGENGMISKTSTSFYMTRQLKKTIDYLCEKDNLPKTSFIEQSIKHYIIKGDKKIDPRIMITERSNPEYIRRDVLYPCSINTDLLKEIKKIAREKNCKEAHILFEAVLDYCADCLVKERGDKL